METKFKNTPWKIVKDNGGTWIEDSKGNVVANVFNTSPEIISAAPIMFQTLVSIIQDIDNIECVRALKGTEITAREIARKAINKALNG